MALMVESGETTRFGLGYILLPVEQEVAVLTKMGWNGEDLPYPLLVQFFKDAVTDALEKASTIEPCPIVVEALRTGSYVPSGVPDRDKLLVK